MTAKESTTSEDERRTGQLSGETTQVASSVPVEYQEWLEQEAHERSFPGDLCSVSELVREALDEYVDELPDIEGGVSER